MMQAHLSLEQSNTPRQHNLLHLLGYDVKPTSQRVVVGHYGDTYVIPAYCCLTSNIKQGVMYGLFTLEDSNKRIFDKKRIITINYSDDEYRAYEKFMLKLAQCQKYRELLETYQPSKHQTSQLFEALGIPRVRGVSISKMNSSTFLHSVERGKQVNTIIYPEKGKAHCVLAMSVHIKRLSQEWREKHIIPKVYLTD